jgi:hypothetical protein
MMATLWIREYQAMPASDKWRENRLYEEGEEVAPVVMEPGVDQAPVTYSANVQSAAFSASTRFVTITSDAAFHYVVGPNPTATTGGLRVPAEASMSFGVRPGDKLAVIAAS